MSNIGSGSGHSGSKARRGGLSGRNPTGARGGSGGEPGGPARGGAGAAVLREFPAGIAPALSPQQQMDLIESVSSARVTEEQALSFGYQLLESQDFEDEVIRMEETYRSQGRVGKAVTLRIVLAKLGLQDDPFRAIPENLKPLVRESITRRHSSNLEATGSHQASGGACSQPRATPTGRTAQAGEQTDVMSAMACNAPTAPQVAHFASQLKNNPKFKTEVIRRIQTYRSRGEIDEALSLAGFLSHYSNPKDPSWSFTDALKPRLQEILDGIHSARARVQPSEGGFGAGPHAPRPERAAQQGRRNPAGKRPLPAEGGSDRQPGQAQGGGGPSPGRRDRTSAARTSPAAGEGASASQDDAAAAFGGLYVSDEAATPPRSHQLTESTSSPRSDVTDPAASSPRSRTPAAKGSKNSDEIWKGMFSKKK
jgi:hypothetical protein